MLSPFSVFASPALGPITLLRIHSSQNQSTRSIMPLNSRRTAVIFAIIALIPGCVYGQGTLRQQTPQSDTRDSNGNLKAEEKSAFTTVRGSLALLMVVRPTNWLRSWRPVQRSTPSWLWPIPRAASASTSINAENPLPTSARLATCMHRWKVIAPKW